MCKIFYLLLFILKTKQDQDLKYVDCGSEIAISNEMLKGLTNFLYTIKHFSTIFNIYTNKELKNENLNEISKNPIFMKYVYSIDDLNLGLYWLDQFISNEVILFQSFPRNRDNKKLTKLFIKGYCLK